MFIIVCLHLSYWAIEPQKANTQKYAVLLSRHLQARARPGQAPQGPYFGGGIPVSARSVGRGPRLLVAAILLTLAPP